MLDQLKKLWQQAANGESRPMTAAWIAPDRAGGVGGSALSANACYVQVIVKRMYLRNARDYWKQLYPVAHSFVALSREGSDTVLIPCVVDVGQLGQIDDVAQELIVAKNIDIIPQTPYIGGTVDVAIGLCAAVSRDYLKNLLGVLGSLSGVIGASPLTQVINVVPTLKAATEQFLGIGDDVRLRVGVVNGFNPDVDMPADGNTDMCALVDGMYALVAAPERDGLRDHLLYENGQLSYRASDGQAYPVQHDHLVFQISQSDKLEDWARFPGLLAQKKLVIEAAMTGSLEDNAAYQKAMITFKSAVLGCADLTEIDRVRIWKGVERLAADYAGGAEPVTSRSIDPGGAMEDAYRQVGFSEAVALAGPGHSEPLEARLA